MSVDVQPRLFANGSEIRRARLKHAETQEIFARRADIGLSTLKAAERSERVAASTITKIAIALDVDASTLIDVRDE